MKIDLLANLFSKRLQDVQASELKGKSASHLLDLFGELKDLFKTHEIGDLEKQTQASAKMQRINEYETVMNAYDRKMNSVRQDSSLDEEDRAEKLEYWKRLRERDITEFESGST